MPVRVEPHLHRGTFICLSCCPHMGCGEVSAIRVSDRRRLQPFRGRGADRQSVVTVFLTNPDHYVMSYVVGTGEGIRERSSRTRGDGSLSERLDWVTLTCNERIAIFRQAVVSPYHQLV
jgi:hypothetical protein